MGKVNFGFQFFNTELQNYQLNKVNIVHCIGLIVYMPDAHKIIYYCNRDFDHYDHHDDIAASMVENESKSEGMLLFTGNATAHGDVYTWWKQGIPAKVCFTTQPKLFRWSTPLSLLS